MYVTRCLRCDVCCFNARANCCARWLFIILVSCCAPIRFKTVKRAKPKRREAKAFFYRRLKLLARAVATAIAAAAATTAAWTAKTRHPFVKYARARGRRAKACAHTRRAIFLQARLRLTNRRNEESLARTLRSLACSLAAAVTAGAYVRARAPHRHHLARSLACSLAATTTAVAAATAAAEADAAQKGSEKEDGEGGGGGERAPRRQTKAARATAAASIGS